MELAVGDLEVEFLEVALERSLQSVFLMFLDYIIFRVWTQLF